MRSIVIKLGLLLALASVAFGQNQVDLNRQVKGVLPSANGGMTTGVAAGSVLTSSGVGNPAVYQAKSVLDVRDFAGGSTGAKIDAACASLSGGQGTVLIPAGVASGSSIVGVPDGCRLEDKRGIGAYDYLGGFNLGDVGANTLFGRYTAAPGVNNVGPSIVTMWPVANGVNNNGGPKSNYTVGNFLANASTQGQVAGIGFTVEHGASNGDTIGISGVVYCSGGANASGDQACQAIAAQALQPSSDFTGTITGIASNVLTYSGGAHEEQRGEAGSTTGTSGYVIDTTAARVYSTGTISSISGAPPVVVGSGTTWTGLTGQYCFSLTNGNTNGTGKYVIPVQTITNDTHITLNYLNTNVQSAWVGDATTGNYSLYPCSPVPAGGVQSTGQITVTSAANFQNGDTIEQPLSASEFGEAMQLNIQQTIPSVIGWNGISMGNLGPRTAQNAYIANGNWVNGMSFSPTAAIKNAFQFNSPGPQTVIQDSDNVDNSVTNIFKINRNAAEGGSFSFNYDKSADAMGFGGAKRYTFAGFSATSLDFEVQDSTGVPRFVVLNNTNSFPMGKQTIWWSDNQGTAKAMVYGNIGVFAANSGGTYTWTSGNADGTIDTGFSRDAAGAVDLGNGTQGNKTGNLNLAALTATGQFTSTLATGTAPLSITSTTVVPNLNVSQLLGNTWAVPGTIGSTTPTTGAFTTVTGKRYNVDQATTLVAGDFVLNASWGATASTAITVTTSKDPAAVITVTSTGAGQAANPTMAFTFHDGTWTQTPVCTAIQTGGNDIFGDSTVTARSATAYTFQWNATPTAAKTYEFTISCTGT